MEIEYKGKYLGKGEYIVITEKEPYLPEPGEEPYYFPFYIKTYISNNDLKDMKHFATAEIIQDNGMNIFDFYVSGEKPTLDEIKKIIHNICPRAESEIFKQVKECYGSDKYAF